MTANPGELSYVVFERHVEAMDYILKDNPEQIPFRVIECMKAALALYFSDKNMEITAKVHVKIRSICILVIG